MTRSEISLPTATLTGKVLWALASALAVLAGCGRGGDLPKAETKSVAPTPAASRSNPVAPTVVPRGVAEIRPWREWGWSYGPPPREDITTTAFPRRLPPVVRPVADIVEVWSPGADDKSVVPPTTEETPTAPCSADSGETTRDSGEQRTVARDAAQELDATAEGIVVNPFFELDQPSNDSDLSRAGPAVTQSAATRDESSKALSPESSPVTPELVPATSLVVTDAVVPGHLQESWFQLIRAAYELANRGARYAGRQEFERVLYEIAQTKDLISGGTHTAALARGLRALEEAADFLPGEGRLSAPSQVEAILSGHQSPVASQLSDKLPATALIEAYHRYAEAELAAAVGGTRAGSMALHALGKLYDHLATLGDVQCRDASDRAITYQRAAIRAHGGNYLAANELGVLLARGGDYHRARPLFVRSLQLAPSREAEHNLQVTDARLAQANGRPLAPPPPPQHVARAPARPQVRWVPVEQFVAGAQSPAPVSGPLASPQSAGRSFSAPRYHR